MYLPRVRIASHREIDFARLPISPLGRAIVRLLIVTLALVALPAGLGVADAPAPTILYVNHTDPTCQGRVLAFPCHTTIQDAIDAVQAGDTIRIQAGEYDEMVLIRGKNNFAGATEADRIVIEADPDAPTGSVILGTTSQKCKKGDALQIESSKFLTIRR